MSHAPTKEGAFAHSLLSLSRVDREHLGVQRNEAQEPWQTQGKRQALGHFQDKCLRECLRARGTLLR
eukprot:6455959-Amphidinium_carterae.1